MLTWSLIAGCRGADVEVLSFEDRGPLETTPAIQGRDGGYSARVGDLSVWAHGDTILAVEGVDGSWLNSSVSWTSDLDASDGITGFEQDLDSTGAPAQFFPPVEDVVWAGPVLEDPVTGGAIVAWQRLGDTEGTGLARWQGPGTTPERIQPDDWFGEVRVNTALTADATHVYALGCQSRGFEKPCTLARTAHDQVFEPDTWTFWDGSSWSPTPGEAATVVQANDIASLHFSEGLGRWLLVYSEPLGTGVFLRSSTELTDRWSRPVHLFDAERADDGELPYSAVAHAEYSEGSTLVVTYHRGTEPWHSELRVVHVELALR